VWIDYLSIKGTLLGVRQAFYSSGVLDFKEMSRRPFVQASYSFSSKDRSNCKL
jgi:hypothetical protein